MKIVIFGSLPPPVGGVTKSIENLLFALKSQSVFVELFTGKSLFNRYDIAHIHYSKSWKRLVGVLLGKIISKKVIFTLHGNLYKNDIFNYLSSRIADGVILLNTTTEHRYKENFKHTIILSSIFIEGMNASNKDIKYIDKEKDRTYLLIYAYGKVFQNSKDIYGVDFILDNLLHLKKRFVLVLLDPQGAYKEEVLKMDNESLIYLDHEVDFISLLSDVDVYLRPTTTDGSSVAVQEALMLGKPVLASDVVERPSEVMTYKNGNFDDFMVRLDNLKKNNSGYQPHSIEDYINFAYSILE